MQKDIIIFFSTDQSGEMGEDSFEIITAGQYYKKNGKHYLVYEDAEEGKQAAVHNMIRLNEDMVEVIRTGAANVHMTFSRNKKTYSNYQTAFGEMLVGFETKGIEYEESEDRIYVRLTYCLEINGNELSDCQVVVRAESKDTCQMNLSDGLLL